MAGSEAGDDRTGPRPVETVRVELIPSWDASLTYDLLDHGRATASRCSSAVASI